MQNVPIWVAKKLGFFVNKILNMLFRFNDNNWEKEERVEIMMKK